jgi:hypothetical protein
MGGRSMPYFCKHGVCVDGGDFRESLICAQCVLERNTLDVCTRCQELEAENQRLREALSDIAETETDWRYGVDENMQVVRNKAYIALQEGE